MNSVPFSGVLRALPLCLFALCLLGCHKGVVKLRPPHAAGALKQVMASPTPKAHKKPATALSPAPILAPGISPATQTRLLQALATIKVPSHPTTAYEQGRVAAVNDISKGRLHMHTYGYPVSWRGTYARLLRQRFGFRLYAVAGCVVTTPLLRRVAGYNKVVSEVIARVYGPNALKQVAIDARRLHGYRLP